MTTQVIITLCILLLIAYVFDISASKTRIPSVVLLLLLGYIVQHLTAWFDIQIPDMSSVLPILGTVGLILIVLEGSLELELNRDQLPFVRKTFISASLPLILISIIAAYVIQYLDGGSFKSAITNAIPLAIISSAIAIPSAHHLSQANRNFVIYESSFSDILGVILFNFVALNAVIDGTALLHFSGQLLAMIAITIMATLLLAFLLGKINHHIKFGPIILMIILIYAMAKEYHLPALIFILLFGLFLRNVDEVTAWKKLSFIQSDELVSEVSKLKELTAEAAFLIRTLFFILFGFLIQTEELLNPDSFPLALAIVSGIILLRYLVLRLLSFPSTPVLFIAPRGLITILLFLSVPFEDVSETINKSLIIQVIMLSAFIMMLGLMFYKPKQTAGE